jgi:hypothetical protein
MQAKLRNLFYHNLFAIVNILRLKMFSIRTDLMLAMVIVGIAFLAVAYVALVIYALDGMDGRTDSQVGYHMLWITAIVGFVEYSMYNALPSVPVKI